MTTLEDFPADQDRDDAHMTCVGGEASPGQAKLHSTPRSGAPVRPNSPASHCGGATHTGTAGGGPDSEQATEDAASMQDPPARSNLPAADQTLGDAQGRPVGGGDLSSDDSQGAFDTRCASAVVAPTPEQILACSTPILPASARALPPTTADHTRHGAQRVGDGGGGDLLPPAPASVAATLMDASPVLADPLLGMAAEALDDLERVRIANENRLRQLTRSTEDSDGEERGFGLTLDHPDVARLAALVDALTKAEHDAALNLQRLVRRHPLGPWVKQARGVGEKQAGRLLAAIGDPYINTLHDRPRTVSELWSYSGYHVIRTGHSTRVAHGTLAGSEQSGGNPDQVAVDTHHCHVGVAATRARGQRANWSAAAKMRAHLVAVSIVKAGGPYRDVYDQARAKYDGATHQVECRRCGPAGKPAPIGSPLSAGHQHARALRIVAKTVLRDLWREAKRLHEEASS